MKYEELCLYLSNPRFERYFIASNLNEKRAILIYKENLKVAQSFYPLISFFEVVLRNKLNHELSNYFSDSNWIINQKSKMMSDPALTYFDKKKQIFIANDFFPQVYLWDLYFCYTIRVLRTDLSLHLYPQILFRCLLFESWRLGHRRT